MENLDKAFIESAKDYVERLKNCFNQNIFDNIEILSKEILKVWESENNIFICGNGGSSANAQHIANDFIYGVGVAKDKKQKNIKGLKIEALTSNANIVTCLANDIGYENIFSYQLSVKAKKGDLIIILSGSGNSSNVLNALTFANKNKITSCSIVGFDGGICKKNSNITIHVPVNDMEIAEDTQMIIFNIIKQWLIKNRSCE